MKYIVAIILLPVVTALLFIGSATIILGQIESSSNSMVDELKAQDKEFFKKQNEEMDAIEEELKRASTTGEGAGLEKRLAALDKEKEAHEKARESLRSQRVAARGAADRSFGVFNAVIMAGWFIGWAAITYLLGKSFTSPTSLVTLGLAGIAGLLALVCLGLTVMESNPFRSNTIFAGVMLVGVIGLIIHAVLLTMYRKLPQQSAEPTS